METCNRHTTEQIPCRPLKQFRRPCETALASTNTNYNSTIALTHFPRPAGVLSTDTTSLFSVDEYVFFVSTKTFYFVKMHTYGFPRKIQNLETSSKNMKNKKTKHVELGLYEDVPVTSLSSPLTQNVGRSLRAHNSRSTRNTLNWLAHTRPRGKGYDTGADNATDQNSPQSLAR